MASYSFSYVERPLVLGPKALLMKANGCPSCIRTSPTPKSLASISSWNYLLKYGKAKTWASTKALFRVEKAYSCNSVHMNIVCFFNSSVKAYIGYQNSSQIFCNNQLDPENYEAVLH
jgi:hypothetical protein